MNRNIPPFYVGQKVKCVKAHSQGRVTVGAEYTIDDISTGCVDVPWIVSVGINDGLGTSCGVCSKLIAREGSPSWFNPNLFRAITDDFQAITFEKVVVEELVSMN